MSKGKQQKMSLNDFLSNEKFGSVSNWADETDQFLPTVPLSMRVPDHLTLHFVPIEHLEPNDIQNAFQGVKNVRFIKSFAYVEFQSENDCSKALERDGQMLHNHILKISPAKEGYKEEENKNWGRSQWQSPSPIQRPIQNQNWDRSTWNQKPITPERQDRPPMDRSGDRFGDRQMDRSTDRPSDRPMDRSQWGQRPAAPFRSERPERPERQRSFDRNDSFQPRPERPSSKADSVSSWRK
eukprot:NODE_75_length_23955_cov_0.435069.p14 type:complete len:239 gc:universal NODE_75_length_23955_cov_0.435069:20330-21046(+)